MQVSVYRYNPEVDEVPQMRDMTVDLPEGKDLMVLDVLELLKAQDPTCPTAAPAAKVCAAPTA
jgi:succinate dehydrogenase / fumarate reductase, iron-sulfur subunit